MTASYLLPIPARHRTDWGAAFIEALDARLVALSPTNLDRDKSRTEATRGGALIVYLVRAHGGGPIEIRLWEDEAEVAYDSTSRRFALRSGPSPTSWIPEAIDFVVSLLTHAG